MKIGALIVILGVVASQVESKGVWINVACIIVNKSLLFQLVCENVAREVIVLCLGFYR